ncbi:hypothetical protein [Chengkuizengella marina]|uniref:Uncharacterized protein n=1 Tax=Chengkuizengella marina TaxID=2507566 RepID=A0A6N9Q2N4_9BACL|nr:hypothetical protein [Chengkuizengella marina]NBI29084.1 hypothetical protein [Chengkuizengella marina]
MNYITRWIFLMILILFTVLLAYKGITLWSIGTDVDGAGIGIYFLGLEINDKVLEERIPPYAYGFLITSLITLLISIILLIKNLKIHQPK